jgi:PAS domain-containing protein
LYLANVSLDITDRKKMEQQLKESEERYRTVADFTYDWEQWVGPKGDFLYVSPSCERITGYVAQDFLDRPALFYEIIHPDDQQKVKNHFLDEPCNFLNYLDQKGG